MSASALDIFNSLPQEQREALAARALNSSPAVYVSLFENKRMREGKNDAQYQGRIDVSCDRIETDLAEARAKGQRNIQYYADVWVQHTGEQDGPIMTGRAKNKVPDANRFEPTKQVKETAPVNEADEAEIASGAEPF